MGLRKLLLTAALLIVGCVPYRGYTRPIPVPQPGVGVQFTHALQKHLIGASARVVVKEKVGVSFDGKESYNLYNPVWTGSAFCIGIENPSDGPMYSVWLTCRHVADTIGLEEPLVEIDYKDQNNVLTWAEVYDIEVSYDWDIAIFKSHAMPFSTLSLGKDSDADNLSVGDYIIAVGHPAGIIPAGITIGAFIGYGTDDDIRFTTTATYGSSGSPVIDAKTMTVVGVLYKFAGSRHRWGYRSDDLKAVSIIKARQAFSLK